MTAQTKSSFKFYTIVGSTLVSNFGSFLNMMAINILVLELTNSPLWVGFVLGARIISGMLVSPYLGMLSDKMNRKKLMILSDLILGIAVLLLVFCPHVIIKPYIILLMVLVGIFSSLFDISIKSAIPSMLGHKDTLKANAILMGGRNFVIGMSALCAVFAHILFHNFNAIFIIDSFTYLISGFVLLSVKIQTSQKRAVANESQKIESETKKLSFMTKLKNEYQPVTRLSVYSTLMLFFVILFFDAFASASHNVGWPILSQSFSVEKPMFMYGVILFFWAMGNVVGIYFLMRIKKLKKLKPEELYLVFTIVMSLGMVLTFQAVFIPMIAIAALIAGIGDGTYQTYFTTYVQKIDDSVRGKVFALTNLVLKTGFGLGFIVIPIVLTKVTPAMTAYIFHGSVVLICLIGLAREKNKGFVKGSLRMR